CAPPASGGGAAAAGFRDKRAIGAARAAGVCASAARQQAQTIAAARAPVELLGSDRQGAARPVLAGLQQLDLAVRGAALELDLGVDVFLLRVPGRERIVEAVLVRGVRRLDVARVVAGHDRRRALLRLAGVRDLGGLREPG